MFKLNCIESMTIEQKYRYMLNLLQAQLSSEKNNLANLSNASAIINVIFHDINWVGFYLMENDELVLGPFQGLPACNRIKVGAGVCGVAVAQEKVQRVYDVHKFPTHIACDEATRSEIVVPIKVKDEIFGVLDIDSSKTGRFTELEEEYLIKFVKMLEKYLNEN